MRPWPVGVPPWQGGRRSQCAIETLVRRGDRAWRSWGSDAGLKPALRPVPVVESHPSPLSASRGPSALATSRVDALLENCGAGPGRLATAVGGVRTFAMYWGPRP